MKLFQKNWEHYPWVKKTLSAAAVVVLILAAIFLYIANIPADEATTPLVPVFQTISLVFSCLAPLAAAILLAYTAVEHRYRKELYKHINRHKTKIYTFDVINFTCLALFCVLCIYPIIYVIAGSFNQGADYSKGGVYLLPRLFTLENYRIVLEKQELWQSYLVTIGRTAIGTVTALIFTSIVAYAMSRPNLRGKNAFYWLNIVTMFFGGGLVPYFLIIQSIGLYNSFWVYIIPSLYSVYNMIVISSFFKSISDEIHEAALMDGASEWRIWWQIYMPLSKPILATVALWLAIGHWNSYFDTMIYTSDDNLHTLQYFLLNAIQSATLTEGLPDTMMQSITPKTVSLAAIIISIIPVLFFFPFVRKNFQSGIMIGSLKG